MSLTYDEWRKICGIEENQRKQIEIAKDIIRRQDRQIALLEKMVRALESQKDIWGRSNADY